MLNTASNLPPESQVMVYEAMLSVQTPNLIMNSAAEYFTMKDRNGNTIRFSRMNRLPTSPVPLSVDGAPRPSTNLVRVDLDARPNGVSKFLVIDLEAVA